MQEKSSPSEQSELRFDGRVVIVTGAGRGMGWAHAELLARRGAKVVVNDLGTATLTGGVNSHGIAEEAAQRLREGGYEAVASTDSVATEEGARSIVETAISEWGRVDGIVHNAALTRYAPLASMTAQDYHEVRAVSLDGAVFLTLAAWPHMQRQGHGRFVFISSTAGLLGTAGNAAYATAKTGMLGLARVIRVEGESEGIRANLLGVAAYTRMTATMFAEGNTPEGNRLEEWWKKHMRPESVAPVAAYLAHEQCPTNGEIFDTKGGHLEQLFLASTRGYTNIDLTMEDVRDHWQEATDQAGYDVYQSSWDSGRAQIDEIVKAGASPLPN